MVHIRYSRWDITQRDSLDSDDVFDQLNDNMNDTGDLQQAMRRLMQKGIKQGDKQTKGIIATGRPEELRDHSNIPVVRQFFHREADIPIQAKP